MRTKLLSLFVVVVMWSGEVMACDFKPVNLHGVYDATEGAVLKDAKVTDYMTRGRNVVRAYKTTDEKVTVVVWEFRDGTVPARDDTDTPPPDAASKGPSTKLVFHLIPLTGYGTKAKIKVVEIWRGSEKLGVVLFHPQGKTFDPQRVGCSQQREEVTKLLLRAYQLMQDNSTSRLVVHDDPDAADTIAEADFNFAERSMLEAFTKKFGAGK